MKKTLEEIINEMDYNDAPSGAKGILDILNKKNGISKPSLNELRLAEILKQLEEKIIETAKQTVEDLFSRNDMETVIENLKSAKGDKGENGDDGYTPIKGIDYRDGIDGYTPVKGRDYRDGKDGRDGRDGVDGKDGKDGINGIVEDIQGADIVAKLVALPEKDRLPASAIKGLNEKKASWKKGGGRLGRGTGNAIMSYDISDLLDGNTKVFTIPANIRIVEVTSSSEPFHFRKTVDYTGTGTTTLTFTSAVDASTMLAQGQSIDVIYVEQ